MFLPATARAHSDEALTHFQAGRTAFENGEYAAALDAFGAAAAAGMSGPAIYFNIGVAAYRAGRYSRADEAFRQVARTPQMAPLAHYNLGLVARRTGKLQTAMRWFLRAERETGDERLKALASAQLDELLAQQLPERNWVGFAALNAGYDDNVTLVSDSNLLEISDTEDGFADLQLALSAPLEGAWRFDGSISALQYQTLDEFDQLNASAAGRYLVSAGKWTNEAGMQLGYATLDGKGLESRRTLALVTRTNFRYGWQLRARYRLSDVDGLADFSGLSGTRQDANVRITWASGPWDMGISLGYEKSDYDDSALSATHQELSAGIQRAFPGGWAFGTEATRRHRRFDAANDTEDLTELAFTASRTLSRRWRAVLRYVYRDNSADRPEFDYLRRRISAGVELTM